MILYACNYAEGGGAEKATSFPNHHHTRWWWSNRNFILERALHASGMRVSRRTHENPLVRATEME